jgi:hypothetical protein
MHSYTYTHTYTLCTHKHSADAHKRSTGAHECGTDAHKCRSDAHKHSTHTAYIHTAYMYTYYHTGVVSVIDVTRALVLWSLPHFQLPVISARMSHVRLPSQRER